MNTLKTKWYSFYFFKEATFSLLFIGVCLVLSAYLGAKTPHLILALSKNYNQLEIYNETLLFLAINFVAVYFNRVVYGLFVNKYIRLLMENARRKTYELWLSSEHSDSEKYPQGEILSRIFSDSESLRELVSSGALGLFIDIFFVISCLVGFISIHKFMGFYISIVEVIAALILFLCSKMMRSLFVKLRNSQGNVNKVTANLIGGLKQIYYLENKNYTSENCNIAFDDFLELQNKINTLDSGFYALAESLYPLLLAFVIIILPYSHLTEVGLIFAIVDLIQRSITPIKEVTSKLANVQRAYAGITRIQSFIHEFDVGDKHLISKNKESDLTYNVDLLSVEIKKFEYKKVENNEKPFLLENIKFNVAKGELVGVIGTSGSGKSTLLNILSGQIKNFDGSLEIKNSGKVVSTRFDPHFFDSVSVVSQESHLFSKSLIFNLTLENETPANFREEWNEYEKKIPYLKKWKDQLDKPMNPENLSLGEKQLLAGLRSCFIRKKIVFFDEISSALDSELEMALRELVLVIQKSSITIIVAHRIETIINASLILLMENGKVKASGTHGELLNQSLDYQNFLKLMDDQKLE